MADSAAAAAAMEEIIAKYKDIRVLVNNAGINADGLFMMVPEADWDAVIHILRVSITLQKPVVRAMVKKRGAIVSISSASALMANRGQANCTPPPRPV